ncbi:MAG: hypothetical protein LAN61_09955 [Acidobacteriia bacterium]|nr:hypothetical protein [Terriglobia bacterium]
MARATAKIRAGDAKYRRKRWPEFSAGDEPSIGGSLSASTRSFNYYVRSRFQVLAGRIYLLISAATPIFVPKLFGQKTRAKQDNLVKQEGDKRHLVATESVTFEVKSN